MAESPKDSELAKFTHEVATALFRAMDSRSRVSDDLLDRWRVTAGIWIDPKEPPRIPDFARSRARQELSPFSRGEVAQLTSRAPLSRESVGRLNDEVGSDPSRALRLLKSLASDPEMWDVLFSLDEEHRAAVRGEDHELFVPLFSRLVDSIAAFHDDLTQVTLEINPPGKATRKPMAARSNPWWVPDKFEVKGTGKNGGWEVSATVTWEF